MNKYLFLVSFLWKLMKGIDKKLLNSGIFISIFKIEKSSIEIIVPVRKAKFVHGTIHYHEVLAMEKKKCALAICHTQRIKTSFKELRTFHLFLN